MLIHVLSTYRYFQAKQNGNEFFLGADQIKVDLSFLLKVDAIAKIHNTCFCYIIAMDSFL